MTSDPTTLPVTELSRLILSRELSPVELVNAYLARISRLNGQVNAYITVMEEEALEQARRAEEALSRGEPVGKLHGIPMAVKDQLHARGVVTTGGSTILKEIAVEDSTVVARLREAGAILLGKLKISASSPWAGPSSTPSERRETLGTLTISRGSRAAAPASPWLCRYAPPPSARTPAARCAYRQPGAASPGSGRPGAA